MNGSHEGRPLRVVFLAHSYPRHPGDVPGSFLLRLAIALRDVNVEVRTLAPAAEGLDADDVLDGIPVRRFRYAARRDETLAYTGNMADAARGSWRGGVALAGLVGGGAIALRRLVRAWRPDLVHAHWWFPGGLTAAMPLARGGRPLVVTMHGSDVRLARQTPASHQLLDHVARRAAAMTAVSSWLCATAGSMAPHLRCEVAPMPVDADRFRPPLDGGARDGLLFVGRLTAQKGVAALLEAFARMRQPSTLTIVAHGRDGDALRARAATLGIADRVRWIDRLGPDALAEQYARARVLVVPSTDEGLGLVAVEALLCGTPVVAFRSGGIPDVVRDGETGLLAPAGDVDALAACLDRLLGDPALAARLGATGQVWARSRFTPAAAAATYRALYDRVLDGRVVDDRAPVA